MKLTCDSSLLGIQFNVDYTWIVTLQEIFSI